MFYTSTKHCFVIRWWSFILTMEVVTGHLYGMGDNKRYLYKKVVFAIMCCIRTENDK